MEETKQSDDSLMELVSSEPKLTGFTSVTEVVPAEDVSFVYPTEEPRGLFHRFDSAPDVLSILSFSFREYRNEVENGFTFDFSHMYKKVHDLKNHTAYFAEEVEGNHVTFHAACVSHSPDGIPPALDVFGEEYDSATKFSSTSDGADTLLVLTSASYKRLFLNKFSDWLKAIQTRFYSNLVNGGYIRLKFTPKPFLVGKNPMGFSIKIELVREDDAPRFVTSIERADTKRVRFDSDA